MKSSNNALMASTISLTISICSLIFAITVNILKLKGVI